MASAGSDDEQQPPPSKSGYPLGPRLPIPVAKRPKPQPQEEAPPRASGQETSRGPEEPRPEATLRGAHGGITLRRDPEQPNTDLQYLSKSKGKEKVDEVAASGSTSAQNIIGPSLSDAMPNDMALEIGGRLPPKSIGNLRCVSKGWNALFSSSDFVKAHLLREAPESIIVVDSSSGRIVTVDVNGGGGTSKMVSSSIFNGQVDAVLQGCCDGLALLWENLQRLVVINPSTSSGFRLPESGVRLITSLTGIGYCSIGEDYKVVVFTKRRVDVFSFKQQCWSRAEDSPYQLVSQAVYADGRLYLLAVNEQHANLAIVSFDLYRNIFDRVNPPAGIEMEKPCKISLMGGSLVVCIDQSPGMDVWRSSGGSWTSFTIHSQNYKENIDLICRLNEAECVLAINSKAFEAYNIATGIRRKLNIEGLPRISMGGAGVFSYSPSLVSPPADE